VASTKITGIKWNLYKGPNGSTTVFSFVAAKEVSQFRGNLKAFFKYLEREQQFPASQYLFSVGAGMSTEIDSHDAH
jgi:xyloglucan-specific endo-beta-1,4-glucanase